ncbi:MAG: 30S ribosomal protein S18 [Phycisphaerae bacterium]
MRMYGPRGGGGNSAAAKKKKKRAKRQGEAAKMRGPKVKIEEIDYKDIPLLQRLTSAQGKLFSRKRSGLDAPCQRAAALAVKRARFLALMPFVS